MFSSMELDITSFFQNEQVTNFNRTATKKLLFRCELNYDVLTIVGLKTVVV